MGFEFWCAIALVPAPRHAAAIGRVKNGIKKHPSLSAFAISSLLVKSGQSDY